MISSGLNQEPTSNKFPNLGSWFVFLFLYGFGFGSCFWPKVNGFERKIVVFTSTSFFVSDNNKVQINKLISYSIQASFLIKYTVNDDPN